jgi:hypothetical protein
MGTMKHSLVIILSILICTAVLAYSYYLFTKQPQQSVTHQPIINCLMITGKTDQRIEYARHALQNFQEQTYPYKRLVILNHNTIHRVLESTWTSWPQDVYEFMIDKDAESLTLGSLRNISLELVGHDDLWTVWDDDDWRSSSYLSTLYEAMSPLKGDVCVAFQNRMEYNVNTGFVWRSKLRSGFPHVLAKFDRRVRYLDKDTMEDLNLITDYAKYGRVVIIDNDPSMYIRLVHGTNTSSYVNPHKAGVGVPMSVGNANYVEFSVTNEEAHRAKQIMSQYISKQS